MRNRDSNFGRGPSHDVQAVFFLFSRYSSMFPSSAQEITSPSFGGMVSFDLFSVVEYCGGLLLFSPLAPGFDVH